MCVCSFAANNQTVSYCRTYNYYMTFMFRRADGMAIFCEHYRIKPFHNYFQAFFQTVWNTGYHRWFIKEAHVTLLMEQVLPTILVYPVCLCVLTPLGVEHLHSGYLQDCASYINAILWPVPKARTLQDVHVSVIYFVTWFRIHL